MPSRKARGFSVCGAAKDWIAAYHKYYGSALTARWHEGISCAPVQGVKIVTGSVA